MELLERAESIGVLESGLAAAGDGQGSVVFVVGEAGIGKTSLTQALVGSLGNRALTLVGACDPLTTPRPLGPVLDIAADPDSGISELVAEGADRYVVFAALLERLRGTIRPTVLMIEDLHWADAATLDFVRFIGRRVHTTNALVVGTYRNDEVGPDHPLTPVVGDLVSLTDRVRMVELSPLSVGAVQELAGDRPVDARRLHAATGGNPFYVTELLAGDDDVPITVSAAVLARLGRLDGDSRRVAEIVSIAPRSLEAAVAVELASADLDAAERAVHQGVLLGEGDSLRFRHELARAAVEASMLPARRTAAHEQLIAILEGRTEPDLARLAHHATQLADVELVRRYAPAAARQALERGAQREAVAFLETALEFMDHEDSGEVADLRILLGDGLVVVNRPSEALPLTAAAVAHYRRSGDDLGLGRALVGHSRALWYQDPSASREIVAEAVKVLDRHPPGPELVAALYTAAHTHMLARVHQPALDAAQRCLELVPEHGTQYDVARAHIILGTIQVVTGDVDEGLAMLEQVLSDSYARNDYKIQIVTLGMLGSGGGEVRRYARALEWLKKSDETSRQYDADYTAAYARAWTARIHFEQGRWDEAAAMAATVAREGARINPITALGALGRVRVRRGDPGAEDVLREAHLLASGQELQHRWPVSAGLAELAWLRNDHDSVQRHVEDDYRLALDTDSEWARGEMGFWMWRAGAIDGPPDKAAEPFALQMAGDWQGAADAWAALGCPYDAAMALADSREEEPLRLAFAELERLGARPAADRTRAELRQLGVEDLPRRMSPAGGGALTTRQREVLALLCEGLADAEIADRLYISRKTAGHHVSAILSKLEVRSRTEAAAVAIRMGMLEPTE